MLKMEEIGKQTKEGRYIPKLVIVAGLKNHWTEGGRDNRDLDLRTRSSLPGFFMTEILS